MVREPHNAVPGNQIMTTTQEISKDCTKATTCTLLVVFTVDENAHHNLRDQQAICNEAESWLESLDAKLRACA